MPVIEITTRKGRTVRVEVSSVPDEQTILQIADEIDKQYDRQQPSTIQQQPQKPQGMLERLASWFMNTRVGQWLASSPTPIAPGGPVARQVVPATHTPAQKPVADPIAEAQALVRQGVPAREASKRLEERLEQEKRSAGSYFLEYLTIPQRIVDENAPDPGLLFKTINLFLAPLYAGVASDIADLQDEKRPLRFRGRDWASLYAEKPTFGTELEAMFPRAPVAVRAPVGFALDNIITSLYGGAIGKVLGLFGQAGKAVPVVNRALSATQWQLLKSLHPTASKAVEQALSEVRFLTTKPTASEKLQALQTALKQADELTQDGDNLIPSAWYDIVSLPPELVHSAQMQAAERFAQESVTRALGEATARELADALRLPNWKDRSDAVRRVVGRLEAVAAYGMNSLLLRDVMTQIASEGAGKRPEYVGALVEALRRIRPHDPSWYERLLSHLKRAYTTLNIPAGAVRNFLGNFLAQYLAGMPVSIKSIVKGKPLNELIDEAFQQGLTRKKDIGEFSRWGEKAARFYSGADKLAAALLARISGKLPAEFMIGEQFALPETIDRLQRWGIVPFASWPTWIAPRLWQGLKHTPGRWLFTGRMLTSTDEKGDYKVEPSTLVYKLGERLGVSIEPFLPISPYELSSERGEAPEILQNWMLPALWRDVMKALAGEGATPKALTWAPADLAEMSDDELQRVARLGPYIDAATTLVSRLSPPAALTLLRLVAPGLFADNPRYQLPQSAYWLRLLGVPVRSVDVVPPEAWETRDLARQLRMRAQAAGKRRRDVR